LTEDKGVINRFGFNSEGAEMVRCHLMDYRHHAGGRGAELKTDNSSELISEEQPDDTLSSDTDESDESTSQKGLHLAQSISNSIAWGLGWAWTRIMSPQHRRGVLGVNLGKNKTSDDEVMVSSSAAVVPLIT
jgi:dihydroorotate dehydrogenase